MVAPADLADAQDAARLAGFLPYLERELAQMAAVLETRVYAQIDKKELTPDMALAAWMEKLAYARLGKRLRQKVTAGTSKGEAAAPFMER